VISEYALAMFLLDTVMLLVYPLVGAAIAIPIVVLIVVSIRDRILPS
jgi:hypothetical protein